MSRTTKLYDIAFKFHSAPHEFSGAMFPSYGEVGTNYHVLFVVKLATREVQIAGLIPEPSESMDAAGGAQSGRSMEGISELQSFSDS